MFAKTVFAHLRPKNLNAFGRNVDSSSASTTPIAGVPPKPKVRARRFTLKAFAAKVSTKVSSLSLPSISSIASIPSLPAIPSIPLPSASKVSMALKLKRRFTSTTTSSKRRMSERNIRGIRLLKCCFSPQRPISAAIRSKDCPEASLAPATSSSSETAPDDKLISSVADVSMVATVDTRDASDINNHATDNRDGDISSSGRSNTATLELEAADATPIPELSQSMAASIQGISPSFWTNDFDKEWSQLTDDEFTALMLGDGSFDQGRAPADSFESQFCVVSGAAD